MQQPPGSDIIALKLDSPGGVPPIRKSHRKGALMRQTTKQAIAESFETLLAVRSIEKISVKDIVTECGINRQTFYYYFHDIYDLMEWALAEKIERYANQSFAAAGDWQAKVKLLFHFFYLNRPVILHGYDATNRMQYERIMMRWIVKLVQQRMEMYPQVSRVPQEKREFICMVYARGITALFLEWVEAGMPDERHVQLDDYFIILDGSMENALDKFVK